MYSRISYVSGEIRWRQWYYTVFTTFRRRCHSAAIENR